MPNFGKIFDKIKVWMYKEYGNNPAKLLVHTGSIGWILSSLAQVTAIGVNDKYSKEDKQFLIPQEIADGAVNVTLFYTLTAGCKQIAEKLFESGKVIVPNTKKALQDGLKKHNIDMKTLQEYNIPVSKIMTDEQALKSFKNAKSGAAIIASLIGSVISSNIVTPIVRNYIASNFQKKSIRRDKLNQMGNFTAPAQIQKPHMRLQNENPNSPYAKFRNAGSMKI